MNHWLQQWGFGGSGFFERSGQRSGSQQADDCEPALEHGYRWGNVCSAAVIRIEDPYGNLRSGDNGTVVTAARAAGSGTLQGTTNLMSINGRRSPSPIYRTTCDEYYRNLYQRQFDQCNFGRDCGKSVSQQPVGDTDPAFGHGHRRSTSLRSNRWCALKTPLAT
jgi:hypothetical protein